MKFLTAIIAFLITNSLAAGAGKPPAIRVKRQPHFDSKPNCLRKGYWDCYRECMKQKIKTEVLAIDSDGSHLESDDYEEIAYKLAEHELICEVACEQPGTPTPHEKGECTVSDGDDDKYILYVEQLVKELEGAKPKGN